jgi:DNA-binding NarL/FixJ family response regulator
MSQAERRQLLLQVDSHMTLRREADDVILTISPGFADPLERVFVFRPRTPVTARHPKARLTPRQMALLCCWQDGQGLRDIAESWGVGRGTVRTISLTIRNLLGVDDLDTAVELVQDRLVRYRETLPLSGRCKQRPPADGSPLSEPLLAVLRLTADGQGCLAIAAALGNDKSTVSRQTRQVAGRLGVESRQDAVRKAQAMGLLP